MNRKIKFRIWANNQFYYKCLVGNTNDTDDKKYTCPVVWLDGRKEWVNCDNGIISQYTGLKDKNGIEIYEGDICKGNGFSDENELFVIKYGKYKTKDWKEKYISNTYQYGWFAEFIKTKDQVHLVTPNGIEVIGNIYEKEVD
jgi:uncharacterized phage protein (TIGR01671 family)